MRIRNISNSPYEVLLEGGGMTIVPAGGVSGDITPAGRFAETMNPAVWRVEISEEAPSPPPPPDASGMSRSEMIRRLEDAGAEVDRRWGRARLEEAVRKVAG